MRIFAFMLILANLAYLGWYVVHPPAREPVSAGAPVRKAPQSLVLLKETAPAPPSAPEESEKKCISLGVFKNTEESDFFVSSLKERGMQAKVELIQAEDSVNYRVYMPPFNSEVAARQALDELKANDIDSFIISGGELAGGISLGLFSREDLALALQQDLAGRGFATSIQEIGSPNTEIWVTIEGLPQALMNSSQLLDLLTAGLDLEVVEKPCETIAPSL